MTIALASRRTLLWLVLAVALLLAAAGRASAAQHSTHAATVRHPVAYANGSLTPGHHRLQRHRVIAAVR